MEDLETVKKVNIDDLIAACNNLGSIDVNDGTYMKDRDCKACLKVIIRHLNHDNSKFDIRYTLGTLNIVKFDLIPLLVQYCDLNEGDKDLLNLVVQLCTNLTSSMLLLYENQEIPTEPESIKDYNKLSKKLFGYKEAFADDVVIWETLNTHLKHTEDEIPFERLLILIRNILLIPVDSTSDFCISREYDAHDMCLYWMDKSGMLQTLIDIASGTQRGTEFCFHIMEIVYLMLRGKNPVTIASTKSISYKRKLDDDDPDKKKLSELRARERATKVARLTGPRFKGSTYVIQNCRGLSDAPMIVRDLSASSKPISFDQGKTELKKNKNRKPFNSELSTAVLSDRDTRPTKVANCLKLFCKQFIEKIYANYMQQIKHNLIQKKAAENDESYYLWAVQFFTAFNQQLCMSIDNISETLSSSTLHFIQILINDYQEKLKLEKKRSKLERISKRLHLALRAYREILKLVRTILNDSESGFHSVAEQITKKLFTEVEYNNMLLSLFQQYDESKHCTEYAKDLIITNEIFLDLGTKTQTMSHYFNTDVVRVYVLVLKDFRTNESGINSSIVRYFERLVYDNHMEVMMMQASIFKILLEIIDSGQIGGREQFTNLAKHLMSKFVTMVVVDKKRWLFQELLFWKSYGDAIEIEHIGSQASVDVDADASSPPPSDVPSPIPTDIPSPHFSDVHSPAPSLSVSKSSQHTLDDDLQELERELDLSSEP